MAVIDLQTKTTAEGEQTYYEWETVTGGDTGAPLYLPKGGAQLVIGFLGTFGAALTMQGTIDGTNWFTLTSGPGGGDVAATVARALEVSTALAAIRPSAAVGVSDVDVQVRVVA